MSKKFPSQTHAPARSPLDPPTTAPDTDLASDDTGDTSDLRGVLPDIEQHADGVELFLDACLLYGIDPSEAATPTEIPAIVGAVRPRWAHYPTNPRALNPRPERIAFVTSGGVKVVHPMDEDFERSLRQWLKAFRLDPKTREIVALPLPEDLTLPRQAITGEVLSQQHQYREGYLRARADAARKA